MTEMKLESGEEIAVFSLEEGRMLIGRICERLGVEPGVHEEREFEDGEHKIRPLESVRGRDVYLVQSLYSGGGLSVNDKMMRVLFFLGALNDAGAARVTAVIPYLAYSRKDMRTKARDPVSTRYTAAMFEAVGIDRMVTVDVHNRAAFQNAFRVPTQHLTAAPVFADKLAELVGDEEVVVVSPDAGGVKRAERARQILQKRLGRAVSSAFVEKYRSEGVVSGGRLVGDVNGKVAVIIDDLISSGTTLVKAAQACRQQGATRAVAAATHGVFSADAAEVLDESALQKVMILDTIAPDRIRTEVMKRRIDVLDAAPLLTGAIHRLHTDGSITELTMMPGSQQIG